MINAGIFILIFIAICWLIKPSVQKLPEVSDEEFLERFYARFSAPRDQIFRARRLVARMFAVPEGKLSPDYNTREVAGRTQPFGDPMLMMSDLEFELMENASETKTPVPTSFQTIGDLVCTA